MPRAYSGNIWQCHFAEYCRADYMTNTLILEETSNPVSRSPGSIPTMTAGNIGGTPFITVLDPWNSHQSSTH